MQSSDISSALRALIVSVAISAMIVAPSGVLFDNATSRCYTGARVVAPRPVLCRARGGLTMFPAAFDYRAPSSLAEALSVLKERGDDAKVMAGGQSLIPLLKLRFSQPALVLDIGRLPAMNEVARHDGHLSVGALVRHVDVERDSELAKTFPIL